MPGGFLQITTYQQDGGDFTNYDPKITFFKSVYKKFTNFSIENIGVQFNKNTEPDWEKPMEYISRIDNIGHLLCNIYLKVDIPRVLQDEKLQLKWINNLGIHIIEHIQLMIGGEIIQEFSSDWINIYYKRYLQYEKYIQSLSLVNIDNSPNKKTILNNESLLYIYIPFYFSKDWSLSIPFLNLEYQSLYLKIKIKPLKQWITIIENKIGSPYYGKRIAPYSNTLNVIQYQNFSRMDIAYLVPYYIQTISRTYSIYANRGNNTIKVTSPNGFKPGVEYVSTIPDGVYVGPSLGSMLTSLLNVINNGGKMKWKTDTQITWNVNFIENSKQFCISYTNGPGFQPSDNPFIILQLGIFNEQIEQNNISEQTDYIHTLKTLIKGRFNISFNAHCAFLETDEFNKLRASNIDYLIDQNTEIIQKEIIEKYTTISINQRLPIKELWILPSRDDTFSRNTYGQYSQLENYEEKDADLLKPVDYLSSSYTPTNFLRQYWFNYANQQLLPAHNIIQNVSLFLDKQYRFKALTSPYLALVQPLIHRYHFNTLDYIYNYSFSINPLQFQPSGFLNMDRINNAQLFIELTNEPPPKPIYMTVQKKINGGGLPRAEIRLAFIAPFQQTFNGLPIIHPNPIYQPQPNEFQPYNNEKYAYKFNIKIIVVNFNILRIKSGMCDLLIRK